MHTILCFSGLDWKECAHSSFYYSGIFNMYDVDVNSKLFALAVIVVFAVRCLHGYMAEEVREGRGDGTCVCLP